MGQSDARGATRSRGCFPLFVAVLAASPLVIWFMFIVHDNLYGRGSPHYLDHGAVMSYGLNLSKGLRQEAEDEEALLYRERIEEGLRTATITDGYGRPFVYVPYSRTNRYGSITALGWHGKEGGDFFDLNRDFTVLFDEVGLFTFEGTNRVYRRKD